MRKLFVALLILSVMGGAFAEVTIGGGVETKAILAGAGYDAPRVDAGPTGQGSDKIMGGIGVDAKVSFSGESEDGKFGGFIRYSGVGVLDSANAWWKPIDQFKMIIGSTPDGGIWGKDSTFGWGFMQGANASVTTEDYGFNSTFYGGTGGGNKLFFEIKPIDLLGINIALPYGDFGSKPGGEVVNEVGDIFKAATAQVSVNLDVANILLTYVGNAGTANNGDLYLGVYLSMIENIGIDVGGHFVLPGDGPKDPISAGVGVDAALSDAFGIKVRLQASFAGDDGALGLGFHLLPHFALSDSLKVAINLGMDMDKPKTGDSVIKYHINPYIELGTDGPAFYAGFKLQGITVDNSFGYNDKMKWAIPIGISFGF